MIPGVILPPALLALAILQAPAPAVEAPDLALNQAVRRGIRGGETHSYKIAATAGQYVTVIATQERIDLVLELLDPQGQRVAEADWIRYPILSERMSFVADAAGAYGLNVRPRHADASAGEYELRMTVLREATDKDRQLVAGDLAYYEADRLRMEWTATSARAALGRLEEARRLYHAVGNVALEGRVLGDLGLVYGRLEDYPNSLASYREALPLRRAAKDRRGEAMALANIGMVHFWRGEPRQALDAAKEALVVWREIHDAQGEGMTLRQLGVAHQELGEYQEALEAFRQALARSRDIRDPSTEAMSLLNLGTLYVWLREPEKALELLRESIPRLRATERGKEATAVWNIGKSYWTLGARDQALQQYERALALAREAGDAWAEAQVLTDIGAAWRERGELKKAVEHDRRALEVARNIEAGVLQGWAMTMLAYDERLLNEPQAALDHGRQAASLAETLGAPSVAAAAHHLVALVCRDRGELREAREEAGKAVALSESLRAGVVSEELRSSFSASVRTHHDLLVDVLMRLHRREPSGGFDVAAAEAAERARARALLELMAEGRLAIQEGIDPELRRREADLDVRSSWIQRRLIEQRSKAARDLSVLSGLEKDLTAVESDRDVLNEEIRKRHPAYAELRSPKATPLAGMQAVLDDKSALVQYLVGDDASYLFVVTRTGLVAHRLPPEAEIKSLVRALRESLGRPRQLGRGSFARAAWRLYQVLLAPAAETLAGKDRLLVSPDGPLHYVPFEALLTADPTPSLGGGYGGLAYLVRRWSVGYVPSTGVLASLRERRAAVDEAGPPSGPGAASRRAEDAREPKELVAFADPVFSAEAPTSRDGHPGAEGDSGELVRGVLEDTGWSSLRRLPDSGREAAAIAGLFDPGRVRLYLRNQASEENVKAAPDLGFARKIHFATHAVVSERRPARSGLILTLGEGPQEDGLLQAHEVFNLRLRADLVVLSACETGLGREMKGEGLVGLTRAFLYAGASSVAVSLWQVADRSTADLMTAFYRQMKKTPDRAEALRQAKLALIAGGRFAHPHYWAPFILIGDPGPHAGPGRAPKKLSPPPARS